MSEKVRNYNKENIEVCRNCKGVGTVYASNLDAEEEKPYKCPVCDGGGRIKKTLKIEIIIEPYP